MAIEINGTRLAAQIKKELQGSIQDLTGTNIRLPKLAMVLIGTSFASSVYVRNKEEACRKVGMLSTTVRLPDTCSESNLLQLIYKLNRDDSVDGILVQLPLPSHISITKVLHAIDPNKDVDGFHPSNVGKLAQNSPHFRACTPLAIMRLLSTLTQSLRGLHAVVVGASTIVGRPMTLELLNVGCTVTICHVDTRDLASHIRQADILVSAIGKQNIIQSGWIKCGAIVIDAGINRTENGLTGDIDFLSAKERAYAITPVPGGVGPMTVAILLSNTWMAYQSWMNNKVHAPKGITT